MGKASRNKQTRRMGRRWSTTDPDTGETQVFTVFIADASLRQWERDRRRLRAGGYPDRPPEVDTPNSRMWSNDARPVHSIALDGAVHALGVDPSARAIGNWRSSSPGDEFGFKLNVGRRTNGVFVTHLVAESLSGFRWDGIAEAATPEALRERASQFADLVLNLGLPEPTWVSTEALLGEVAAAIEPEVSGNDDAA